MTSRISHTTVDAINAVGLVVRGAGLEDPDDPNEPGHELCPIMSHERSQVVLFITAPGGEKKLKNRLHFDLRPVDGTRDQRVLPESACHCQRGDAGNDAAEPNAVICMRSPAPSARLLGEPNRRSGCGGSG